MKKLITILSAVLVSTSVFALDLDSARSSGAVGEKQNGYIAAVNANAAADVKALVGEVNAKRKAAYQEISSKNGQPLNVVEKLAAQKVIEGLGSGQFYQDASGKWQKK